MADQGTEALQNLGVSDILPPDGAESGTALFAELREQGVLHRGIKLQQQDGTPVPALIDAVALPDGNFYCALHDIRAHRREESRLHHSSTRDPLTGLPNRALFLDRLNYQLAYTHRHQGILALLLIDLEGFKEIKLGDEILGQIAVKLRNSVRKSDTLVRLGGDEFAATLQDPEDAAGAAEVARKVLGPIAWRGRSGISPPASASPSIPAMASRPSPLSRPPPPPWIRSNAGEEQDSLLPAAWHKLP